MAASETIRWERGDDGVVVLVLDDPNQSANTMTPAFAASLRATVDRLEAERDDIVGVILTSAKKTFFAGGDLNDLRDVDREQAPEVDAMVSGIKADLRRLETLGRPSVAAIAGAALGGGLEIALGCHHRIALDDPRIKIGLPEVTLGLLPGGGGIVRTVRMLGIADSLTMVLLTGTGYAPAAAQEIGLVDELVASAEDLIRAAKAWIAANPEAVQPWDQKGYEIPGGGPEVLADSLPAFPANLRKQIHGANMPAPKAIMAAAVEGAQVDIETAAEIEGRYFISLLTGQVAKNMIQAFFFDMQEVNSPNRTAGEAFDPGKVAVLGAGMMGAGIAYVCAKAGIEVVLKDVSLEAAERGKSYSQKLVEKGVARGSLSGEAAQALLDRIVPTADAITAATADVVIEAVFEDPEVKAAALKEIDAVVGPETLLGSNTSSLPITGLADSVTRPGEFIGLHFFSPVDKMPLLEIISGEATSEATRARALGLARKLGKTPILVNDSRGFFTSRVIATFINEGIAMLGEGVPAPSVEQASQQAGYPAPVLQLSDELNLELMQRIRDAAAAAEGDDRAPHPAEPVIDKMVDELGRPGRLAGAGFYEYEDGKRGRLWPGLAEAFGSSRETTIELADLKDRLLFAEALEAVRAQEEGVIESVADANVGSILGIGYPGWTGGVLQFVEGYGGGVSGFVARARELAERYGSRFEPPPSLVARAEQDADPVAVSGAAG